MTSFRFASELSTAQDPMVATEATCRSCREQLGAPPDAAVVFLSADLVEEADAIASRISEELQTANIIGCTGESIVGTGRELERETGISLWAACLPGVHVARMHLAFDREADGGSFLGWPDRLWDIDTQQAGLIVLADPFTFPAEWMLRGLNDERPGLPVMGGMASAGIAPGQNRFILGESTVADGAVGLLFDGPLKLHAVVSQGCRPIGEPFIVTSVKDNVLCELGGEPALQRLQDVYECLPNREKESVQKGLHLGRVVSEYQDSFEQGDFLIRNVLGIDAERGTITVGDQLRPGQTVQFHIRDAHTADAEMRERLTGVPRSEGTPRGGLIFTCNGRGSRLFGELHHDAQAVQEALGEIPLAGFFAAGELGPVGGTNFMHGFTASIAVLEPVGD